MRGFPVEINLEEGENDAEGLNEDADEMFWTKLRMEVGMCPRHHLSLIKGPTGNNQ